MVSYITGYVMLSSFKKTFVIFIIPFGKEYKKGTTRSNYITRDFLVKI